MCRVTAAHVRLGYLEYVSRDLLRPDLAATPRSSATLMQRNKLPYSQSFSAPCDRSASGLREGSNVWACGDGIFATDYLRWCHSGMKYHIISFLALYAIDP